MRIGRRVMMRNQPREQVSLSKQVSKGFRALVRRTAQVASGLILMLVITGDQPPGWLISTILVLGMGLVVGSEIHNRRPKKEEAN